MIQLQAPRSLRHLRHKPMLVFLLLLTSCGFFDADPVAATEETTTQEPDASPGCRAPDIRFNIVHPETTTDVPYAKFETTPGYMPDDFTTSDADYIEKINIDLTGSGRHDPDSQASVVNPYQIDLDDHHSGIGLRRPSAHGGDGGGGGGDDDDDEDEDEDHDHDHDHDEDDDGDSEGHGETKTTTVSSRKRNNQNRKKNQRRNGGRRRLENDNGQSRGGRGSRYKRQVIHYDPDASPETDKWSGSKLAAEGDVYYVHIEDILKSRSPNAELRLKLHKIKRKGRGGARRRGSDQCAPGESKDNCRKDGEKETSATTSSKRKKASEAELMAEKEAKRKMKLKKSPTPKQAHHRRRGDSHEGAARHPPHGDLDVDVGASVSFKADVHDPRSKRSVRERWRRSNDGDSNEDDDKRHNDDENDDSDDNDRRRTGDDGNDDRRPNVDERGDVGSYDNNVGVDEGAIGGRRFETLPTPVAERNEDPARAEEGGLQRVKRKSGKTTGALSRPKGGGDSSSKTTSRKDKGIYDEEGAYAPVHPDEEESEEEEEEEEEVDIEQQFTEVSEIRFPGEIGPLGDRRLCKIRCVKGKWVGPLCATNEEDDNGNVKFQPLYKSCHVTRIPPHLLLSYRNISVTPIPTIRGSRRNRTSKSTLLSNTAINVGWDLPHGHSLQARCKDLGLYKLLGESRVLCSNGLWAPRMPSCVPTTLLTNFSDDSAPSIRIKISDGSGAFEPSGVLAVLPGSNINLDCMYPRARGTPEWTWTSWYMQYPTGWSKLHEEQNLRYRLTIKGIQQSDSGTFTCTSPRGLTNSIPIVVATSQCPQLPEPAPPLTLRLEGVKLGQRAMYRCPPGYRIDGTVNATCLASGNWSSPPPTCQAIQCPRLVLEDPHLSLVELNTSAWGRAVFKCQWGFKLSGPPGLECEPTGMWSGPVPRCRAIQCVTPTAPLNGRIGGTSSSLSQRRLTVGALVTFSCNEGHILQGEPSIICTETGVWSHEIPFCKSQCPYPGDPANGLIAPLKFHYDSGDLLTVQCRPGFVQGSENGPLERPRCMPDGNWSGPVPQCHSYDEV